MVSAGCCSASRRICDTPSSAACAAADSPDGPEPMMAILNIDEKRLASRGSLIVPPHRSDIEAPPTRPRGRSQRAMLVNSMSCASQPYLSRSPASQVWGVLKCETAHRRQYDPCMLDQQKLEA